MVARWFFFHYLIRFWERIVAKIPFINGVYKACRDIIQTLFASSSHSFKQVVMAPYPGPGMFAIGLVTKKNIPAIGPDNELLSAVFIPTTPNPTSGFLIIFKEKDLVYLDMKVEDALKYVISCGVIETPLNRMPQEGSTKDSTHANTPDKAVLKYKVEKGNNDTI